MKRLLLGFKTANRTELGEVLYLGTDGDEEQKIYKKSDYYRYEFFQIDHPRYRKFKEENQQKSKPAAKVESPPVANASAQNTAKENAEKETEGADKVEEPKEPTKKTLAKKAAKKVAKKVAKKTAKDTDLL